MSATALDLQLGSQGPPDASEIISGGDAKRRGSTVPPGVTVRMLTVLSMLVIGRWAGAVREPDGGVMLCSANHLTSTRYSLLRRCIREPGDHLCCSALT